MTVKYRRSSFTEEIEQAIVEVMEGVKERYEIEVHTVDFDKSHVYAYVLCRFWPKYSGGQVVWLMKSITAQEVFRWVPSIKQWLCGAGSFGQMGIISDGERQKRQESD